jgi:hypothetical protein
VFDRVDAVAAKIVCVAMLSPPVTVRSIGTVSVAAMFAFARIPLILYPKNGMFYWQTEICDKAIPLFIYSIHSSDGISLNRPTLELSWIPLSKYMPQGYMD